MLPNPIADPDVSPAMARLQQQSHIENEAGFAL